ncbi:MAG: energy-coupling factor transporter transmembrane protein EcfT [Actinobacteria bacterium]|nr:energy-coupling factor transporter transmembrane protein EcfT [Actinomycetota bacterium]
MKTVLNDFDVRTKLAIAAALSTIAVFIQHVYVLCFILFLSVLLSFLFYGNFKKTLRATRRLWYIFFAIVVLQSIFIKSGSQLIAVGSFSIISAGGLLKGAEFLLRMSIIIFTATIVASSSYREVVQGIVQLKIPYEIAFMVSVAIRFLPILKEEFSDILTAIQLRGLDIKKIPFKKRLKVYSYIITPVIAGAVDKAQKLSIAMETRAFRAYPKRTSYLILKLAARDYIFLIFLFIFTVAVFISYYLFGFPGRIL